MRKVAFIYFDDLHHINHFVGVAVELSKYEKHSSGYFNLSE